MNYEKLPDNPVIDINDADFRDPKLNCDGEKFSAIIAHRADDGYGKILTYQSPDLKHWEKIGVFDKNSHKLGRVWGCPDLFALDGKRIQVLNFQETEAGGNDIHPGNTIFKQTPALRQIAAPPTLT
jgi:beta-fructofuranosidase